MKYYCNICKKDITRGEYSYSMDKFGRALCRQHQEIERATQKRSTAEQQRSEKYTNEISGSNKINSEDPAKNGRKSLAKKVAVKMGKGVVKGVKSIVASSKKRIQNRKWKDTILRKMKMSQLKQFCFEKKISTKKSVLREDKRSEEVYWEKVDCSKSDLVSRLRNKTSLESIISFAKRNRIDIKDVLDDIERKKSEWEKKEISEINEEIDLSPEHRWRIEVLTRDNHTCRVCGKVGVNSAHHIYSRKYCQVENHPDLEWDNRNGITACYECHKKITLDGQKWFKENEKI